MIMNQIHNLYIVVIIAIYQNKGTSLFHLWTDIEYQDIVIYRLLKENMN